MAILPFGLTLFLEVGSAAPDRGTAPASGSPLNLLYAVVEQAVAANGGVQGHWGLVVICDGGASLGTDGNGLADVPRIAVTPSSLLVLHGEPGSVISLVPLLLHSPQDTATPLKQRDETTTRQKRHAGSSETQGSKGQGDVPRNSQRSRIIRRIDAAKVRAASPRPVGREERGGGRTLAERSPSRDDRVAAQESPA